MQRLISRSLLSRTLLYSRTCTLKYTTGIPTRCLSRLLNNNGQTKCKYTKFTIERNKQLYNKGAINLFVHGNATEENINQQGHVKGLVDLYVSSRGTQHSVSPLEVLDSITKFTRKSAKQSIALLLDPDISSKFDILVKDIEVIVHGLLQSILPVLCSLAEISARQKTYLDQTGITIYTSHVTSTRKPNDITITQETHEIGKSLFMKFESSMLSHLDCATSKELVDILWCFVETGFGSKHLFEELKNRILGLRILDLTIDDIAKVTCSFAKLKSTVDFSDVMIQMEEELLRRGLVGLGKQEIVDTLFSFASIQHGNLNIYTELMKELLSRDARSFTPSQICKILWSFTKVSNKHDLNLSDLFNRFENEILRRGVKRFDIRGLAVITWSFVEAEHFSKRLFTLLRNEIKRRNIRTYNADDLSVILRAFAKVNNKINANQFFAKVDKELLHRDLDLFTNRHLATTLWSFAETGNGSHAFYDRTKKVVMGRNIQDFTATELSQTIWSFAKAREKVVVNDFFLQVNYNLTRLSLRQLALVGWSYAVADVIHVTMLTALNKEISKRDLRKANNPMVCQIMYALASVKGVVSSEKITRFFEDRLVEIGARSFGHRQLAVLVWSFCELHESSKTTQIYDVLGKEVCSRSLNELMPSDFCRILWGFGQVHHLTDTTVTFHTLIKELLRRGLWEFSIAQVTMATVALSTANQWDAELIQLFQQEITGKKNSRSFESLHLCSLAKSFSLMNPLDANELFCWLEEEVIGRNVNSFLPRELFDILGVLVDRKSTNFRFFETVNDQLVESHLKNYSEEDVRSVCALLVKAGIDD